MCARDRSVRGLTDEMAPDAASPEPSCLGGSPNDLLTGSRDPWRAEPNPVSADIAVWRLQVEEFHPPEHFDPLWKLGYMWEHPFHFPLAAWNALSGWGDRLWGE